MNSRALQEENRVPRRGAAMWIRSQQRVGSMRPDDRARAVTAYLIATGLVILSCGTSFAAAFSFVPAGQPVFQAPDALLLGPPLLPTWLMGLWREGNGDHECPTSLAHAGGRSANSYPDRLRPGLPISRSQSFPGFGSVHRHLFIEVFRI